MEPEDDLISGGSGATRYGFDVGAEVNIVYSGPAGSRWDDSPLIETADNAPAPVELVRLELIENPDVWYPRTPVLVMLLGRNKLDPDHFQNWKGKTRPEGKTQQFVVWRFRGIAPGSATITLTRQDATGAKKTVQMILAVQ